MAFLKKKFRSVDEDGLPKVGHFVNNGEIYVNKKIPILTPDIKEKIKNLSLTESDVAYIDRPSVLKAHTALNVDKVILTSN